MPAGGGGGGGGCGGGGGGFGGGGFHSYSSGCSTTAFSSGYSSYTARSVATSHVATPSYSSASTEQRAERSGNKVSTTSQLTTHASTGQSQTRETNQTNTAVGKRKESLAESIYLCVSTCLMCGCLCCCISAFIVPFVVIGVLGNANFKSTTDIATNFFSPGDSRVISFSSFFCDGADVKVDSNATGATLYLVDTLPPLSDMNKFTITDMRTLNAGEFRFWQYYLYSSSNITVSVCSSRLDVYIVQGNSNANKWARSPGAQHAREYHRVTKGCPQEEDVQFTVKEQDQYYIILHNPRSRRISYNLKLSIERFEYDIEAGNYTAACNAPSGMQCSVDIPYGTSSQLAMVVTSIPADVDWGENVDVMTSCNRRDWEYAVFILPTILVFTIIVGLIATYLIYNRKYCEAFG